MKRLSACFALLSLLSASNGFATDLPQGLVFEYAMHVGFAPPDFAGTYRFQLLDSGEIVRVDNKGKSTLLANLTPLMTQKIQIQIEAIQSVELETPRTPPCTDVPTSEIQVRNVNGHTLQIWRSAGCLESTPIDPAAKTVVNIVSGFEHTFGLVERAK